MADEQGVDVGNQMLSGYQVIRYFDDKTLLGEAKRRGLWREHVRIGDFENSQVRDECARRGLHRADVERANQERDAWKSLARERMDRADELRAEVLAATHAADRMHAKRRFWFFSFAGASVVALALVVAMVTR
jgi:hypothetical protein